MRVYSRLVLSVLFFFPAFALTLPDFAVGANIERSCKAHYEVVATVPAGDFKPDIPVNQFTVWGGCNSTRPNECRRKASNQAHKCMQDEWDERWTRNDVADSCSTTYGVRGYVLSDLKDEIEKAACCDRGSTISPIKKSHEFKVKVYRRTHGDNGCGGSGTSKRKNILISDYVVDCPGTRSRFDCGPNPATKASGIDRPGADYTSMRLNPGDKPRQCEHLCEGNPRCKAWTYVKAGVQDELPKCWLKDSVPWAKRNSCCTSGVTAD